MVTSDFEIRERFDPALIKALYQNFKDPIQAIIELVDNAVDDIIEGKKMSVTVDCEKDHISIVNKGGSGMGPEELKAFFAWGRSGKRGKLGRYGQGGKAAMGYLGKAWEIKSTKINSDNEYIIEEIDWDDRTSGLKKYKPIVEKTLFVDEGVVQIDVTKLKRKINKNELRRVLGKVYRPLIKLGKVEMLSNRRVVPEEFPLEMPEEHFGERLSNGKRIAGWVGILEKGSKVRGGIRCYVFGRLVVEREFFGQKDPTFKESLGRLIGELYIDDEELPLLINKTDVDRASPVWNEIEKKMYLVLEPYIEVLLDEKERDLPTEKERGVVNRANEIWTDFMKYLQKQRQEGTLPALPGDYGQKRPEMKETEGGSEPVQPTAGEGRGFHEPATPPPPGAIGKRKRTWSYLKPDVKPLHESVRYELGKADGEKIIFINSRYPLYKLRKGQLPLYVWETLAMVYAKEEDSTNQTADNFEGEVNHLLYNLGVYLRDKGIKTDKL